MAKNDQKMAYDGQNLTIFGRKMANLSRKKSEKSVKISKNNEKNAVSCTFKTQSLYTLLPRFNHRVPTLGLKF